MPPATATAPVPATAPAPKPKRKPVAPAGAAAPVAAAAPAAEKPKKQAPPRAPNSATEEEVSAAVAGTLAPRDTKGARNQEALTTRTEGDRRGGRPLGVTTGLPILLAWCLAFQENEKPTSSVLPKLGHKTDEAITTWMKSEFPGRDTPAFDHPASCRNDYNSGKFTKLNVPKVVSHRFDENGAILEGRARGTRKPKTSAPAAAKAPTPATPATVAAAAASNAAKKPSLLKKKPAPAAAVA